MATTQAIRPARPRYVVPAPLRNFEFVGTLSDWLEDVADVQDDRPDDDCRWGLGPDAEPIGPSAA